MDAKLPAAERDTMTDTNNGWPGKPGVPRDPEKDGWHWLYNKRLDREHDFKECVFWSGVGEFWQMMGAEECFSSRDLVVREWRYFGPCLTPDEATALQARVAELEGLVAYLCGRNTDHIQVALAGNPIVVDALVKRAEAALEGKKE